MNNNALNILCQSFGAVPADKALCCSFLEDGKELILGLSFPDSKANYHLLSPSDLAAFPPEQAARIQAQQQSPFHNMLLIFYEQDGRTLYKLVNGMGSNLLSLADQACSP